MGNASVRVQVFSEVPMLALRSLGFSLGPLHLVVMGVIKPSLQNSPLSY